MKPLYKVQIKKYHADDEFQEIQAYTHEEAAELVSEEDWNSDPYDVSDVYYEILVINKETNIAKTFTVIAEANVNFYASEVLEEKNNTKNNI